MLNKVRVTVDLHSATSTLFASHNSPSLRPHPGYHCPGEKLPGRDKHWYTSEKLLRDVSGVSGWEPTCQRRPHGTGWIPGAGRLSRAAPQRLKPACREPMRCHERSHRTEAGAPRGTVPRVPRLEKACAKQQAPSTAKNKEIHKNF